MTEESTESGKLTNGYLLQTLMDEEFSFSGVCSQLGLPTNIYPPGRENLGATSTAQDLGREPS